MPDTPITDAQQLMQEHNIRHLPVVSDSEQQHLVGLLNRETVIKAVPWSAASLSVLETQYVLSKITVGKVMLHDVLTVSESATVEEAARTMVDNKISCLPVLRQGVLVGIITDIDLLSTAMEMLGAREPGLRIAITVPDRVGEFSRLSTAIAAVGGSISAFGTWSVGKPGVSIGVVLKVTLVSRDQLISVVEDLEGVEILDVRQM
jgi:acetoin utilization protein AcuB